MALLDDRSAAFIVRVWCERSDPPAELVRDWRGSIEHVESGDRMYFRELAAIGEFMTVRLKQLGVETPDRFWDHVYASDRDDTAPRPG